LGSSGRKKGKPLQIRDDIKTRRRRANAAEDLANWVGRIWKGRGRDTLGREQNPKVMGGKKDTAVASTYQCVPKGKGTTVKGMFEGGGVITRKERKLARQQKVVNRN